jgi:hypothetical protein
MSSRRHPHTIYFTAPLGPVWVGRISSREDADNQGTKTNNPAINQTANYQRQKRRHGISREDAGTHLNKFDIKFGTKNHSELRNHNFPIQHSNPGGYS